VSTKQLEQRIKDNRNKAGQEAKQEQIKKYLDIIKSRRHNATALFNCDKGITFLKWLSKECGQGESSTVFFKDGEIQANSLIHNEAMRLVYLKIRELLSPELIYKVELEDMHKEDISEQESSS